FSSVVVGLIAAPPSARARVVVIPTMGEAGTPLRARCGALERAGVARPRITRVVVEPAFPGMSRDVDTPSPLLIDLNPIQREAVLHTEGPVLIVAGAGSGKTRALTHRIAYLIRETNVSPYAVLAITFTNKAAQEMAERVEGLMGSRIAKGMWILTFHSACVRILRREHDHVGLPSSFTIYDENDTERVISLVEKQMDLDPKRYPVKQVAAMIGHAKDHLEWPDDYRARAKTYFERTVVDIYEQYQKRLQKAG